ncbi:MAG: hypothetical protein LC799_29975 [Actinobacteria bacterium]|nr:hypothetical protein [Actinomycetota bacterium]
MSRARGVVLDNEAVQALLDPDHRKHRRVLAAVEAVTARALRRAGSTGLVVPTAVRVEAGWDRRAPGAAAINRMRVHDAPLDRPAADRAAGVRHALGVSVADAHLAAVIVSAAGPVAVLTSDVVDLRRIAGHLDADVTEVAL